MPRCTPQLCVGASDLGSLYTQEANRRRGRQRAVTQLNDHKANTTSHARCTQDFGGFEHVYIYGGNRTSAWFEHGDGGASSVFLDHLSCSTASTGVQVKVGNTFGSGLAYGTTVVEINDLVLGGPSAGASFQMGNGLLLQGGGQVSVKGGHAEAMPAGIEIDFPSGTGNNDMVSIERFNAGAGSPAPACTGII